MAQGCGFSKSASRQGCVVRSLGGKRLETVSCPVCNLSARGDNNHRAVPKLLEQCHWLFPNPHSGIVSNIEMLRTLHFNDFLLFLLFYFFFFLFSLFTHRKPGKETNMILHVFIQHKNSYLLLKLLLKVTVWRCNRTLMSWRKMQRTENKTEPLLWTAPCKNKLLK